MEATFVVMASVVAGDGITAASARPRPCAIKRPARDMWRRHLHIAAAAVLSPVVAMIF
jgi:hypothetical protein